MVDGFEVHKQPRLARKRLGAVFQDPSLDTRLTAEKNLDLHGRVFGVPGRLRRQRIQELLELIELSDWKGHLVRSISKDMQRRRELTLLVTTHYIEEVDGCNTVCIVDHGKVLTVGSPSDLKRLHSRVAPIRFRNP